MTDRTHREIAASYTSFAETEVCGRSPLYEAIARGVASSNDAIAFLAALPAEKRQPNLLLAAERHVCGLAADWPAFLQNLLHNADAVRSVMLSRSTQTNEPARCATLLPVLARLPQPLALLEVGASAGLCLLPDCYSYDYAGTRISPLNAAADTPVFACAASATTPLPSALPQVVWRAGLDLNPLDAADAAQAAWLETLVWPEQSERLTNLRRAMGIAATRRPRIVRGDLRGDALSQLCREAPADATLIVFHTAVLAYVVGRAERQAFAMSVSGLCDYWICNESPSVFPEVAARVTGSGRREGFLLSVNAMPVAWTDPHGAAIDWIAEPGWTAETNVRLRDERSV